MRKVNSVANRNTHVHDATAVRNFSDSDRFQRHVDISDQALVTVACSSHDSYIYMIMLLMFQSLRLLNLDLSPVQVRRLIVISSIMSLMLLI